MPLPADLMLRLQAKQAGGLPAAAIRTSASRAPAPKKVEPVAQFPEGKLFLYDSEREQFLFDLTKQTPLLIADEFGNSDCDILVPIAPCVYRMTDYTIAKKQPIEMRRCILKLGVLRCLQRECKIMNKLLWYRLSPSVDIGAEGKGGGSIEEDELGKSRFMELLSNCGVYQKVSELILKRAGLAHERVTSNEKADTKPNPYQIPQVRVDGLDDFLEELEKLNPSLQEARNDIQETQTVSFNPGLGELFTPGAKLVCHPEGMEGSPLGCSCVQSWYTEELNKVSLKRSDN
jgi:hypothetical protein